MKAKIPNALLNVAYWFSLPKSRSQLYRACTELALFSDESYVSTTPTGGEHQPWDDSWQGARWSSERRKIFDWWSGFPFLVQKRRPVRLPMKSLPHDLCIQTYQKATVA
jgi:hypothetical protein